MEDTRREAKQRYDSVGQYHDGVARVRLNEKYGFIDHEGNEVMPPCYDWVGHFRAGIVRVHLNGKWGGVDLNCNEIIPCWYESIVRQSYGFKATNRVSVHAVEHLYFDLDGSQIAEPTLK